MENIPSSVYRFQMSHDLPLKKVSELIPYLFDLGVEGIYCSPLFLAFSHHGYDVTDPTRINPALGSMEDFNEFCTLLQQSNMKHLLDIIPNHMGIKGNKNRWWLDVMENGSSSAFADFFDINWTPEKIELHGKVLLPILAEPYERILERGHIQLFWNEGFWARYFDFELPICYPSYTQILESELQAPEKEWLECLALSKTGKKQQFVSFCRGTKCVQNLILEILSSLNKRKDLLNQLLQKQFYQLAWWKVAGQEINYRRFSNINELVCIHIENEKVLNAHHQWIFELLATSKVQGLRVDHPDGLYDPGQYFERIRKKKPAFIWAEKILDVGETLPEEWNVDGSVGYDFLNVVSGVFIQKKNEQKITEIYERFVEDRMDLKEIRYERRKRYLGLQMSSEINHLGHLLSEIFGKNQFAKNDLTKALLEIFACFPIYRTYIKPNSEIRKKDRESILNTLAMAKKRSPEITSSVFDSVGSLLLLEQDYLKEEKAVHFVMRFQQLTAAVMVKGLEDSTFYIYNRLISLNEVGGNPHHFGFSKSEFHAFNRQKRSHSPLGALASSTHDTKYSEDARLRIHALSEVPEKWEAFVTEWKNQNQKHKTLAGGNLFPDENTEYFIYQTLIAIWPADQERLWTCLNKALREAGIYSSWFKVNEPYETAVKKFLEALLTPNKENGFYLSFLQFQKEIANYGLLNSLSALVLKIGSCGIVDLFQGSELMNYSLMDPDNRRPIDFAVRKEALQQGNDQKMLITAKALNFRRNHKELFLKGAYVPLRTPDNVIAFMRKWRDQQAIFIARRFFSKSPMNCQLKLPKSSEDVLLHDLLTGKKILPRKGRFDLSEVLDTYNCAILTYA